MECKRNAGTAAIGQDASTTEVAVASKRRKVDDDDKNGGEFGSPEALHSHDDTGDDGVDHGIGSLGVNFPAKSAADTCSPGFFCSDRFPAAAAASCCSSNESSEVVKDGLRLVDLEAKSNLDFETAESTSINNNTRKFSTETTPSSELCVADSEETESPAAKTPPSTAPKLPPGDEIEEFFATAEKSEQKRFAEKYNYDIAKDSPLEGRYKWVCLKP